ncbi:MAG: hypothetical protein AB3N64_02330 [Puniceicoccaceae bacterium]
MEESVSFKSIDALLAHPEVRKAGTLELSICDIVHFRLLRTDSIFQLVEQRLRQRDDLKYTGFAEVRETAEQGMRGSTILEKIDACCTKRPEWLDDRQVLYSFELEAWMDMSYPNAWALDIYHKALVEGLNVTVPHLGPFTDTFHTLLKEKNGYELTKPSPGPDKVQRVLIGDQALPGESALYFQTEKRFMRKDAYAGEGQLAAQLVHGLLQKDLEDQSARPVEEDAFLEHLLGYRLIGPTLVVLFQSLAGKVLPVSFHGTGRNFLTKLAKSVQAYWPWLPEIEALGVSGNRYSIFHSSEGATSLLSVPGAKRGDCILELPFDVPSELLLPAMELIMTASFKGPGAEAILAAAAGFVRDYAKMTRGLHLPVPMPPVIRQWCQFLLSPEPRILGWATEGDRFPGFEKSKTPWHLHKQVNKGPWPTGSYCLASGHLRWLALRSEARAPEIVEARSRYA